MRYQIQRNKYSDLEEKREIRERIQKETIKRLYKKSAEERAVALAKKLRLPYLDLNIVPISVEAVNSIPEEDAKRAKAAVIYKAGRKFQIAVADPENYETKKLLERLKNEKGISYRLVVVSENSLKKTWLKYKYDTITEKFEINKVSLKEEDLTEFEKGINNLIDLKNRISEINTTEIFNIIMAGAIKTKSSDIHIEPYASHIRLRYRVDGVLQDVINLPKKIHRVIVSRVKMLSKMKLNVTNMPQDGNFSIDLKDVFINVRSSILPTNFGESIVLRVLLGKESGYKLDEIGLNQYHLEVFEEQAVKTTGMILATGPTGSGKTTTLYSFMKRINLPNVKIITLENPIEYVIDGVSQTEAGGKSELKFSDGLRAVVRQDPDIIMVGEIRDSETANIAIQAALTGHLVISTLHTNNASGAIPRLLHLRINPFLVTPAINMIIAQRLVRRLCSYCKEEYTPASETIDKIKKILLEIPKNEGIKIPEEIKVLYRSKGCSKCNFIGYSGRIGIYEILTITKEIEKVIFESGSLSEIMEESRKNGMIFLQEDGILKALEGITSIEEITRVTGNIFSK